MIRPLTSVNNGALALTPMRSRMLPTTVTRKNVADTLAMKTRTGDGPG